MACKNEIYFWHSTPWGWLTAIVGNDRAHSGLMLMAGWAGGNWMLHGRSVLIAEDEPVTAMDLMHAVEADNGRVLGPFSTLAAGLAANRAAEVVHGAILDGSYDVSVVAAPAQLSSRLSRGRPFAARRG